MKTTRARGHRMAELSNLRAAPGDVDF